MLPTDYNDGLVPDFTIVEQPTLTYRLNFAGRLSYGYLNGLEAMKQAIFLILHTERFQHAIYSWNYGIELFSLIGKPKTPLLQAKLQKSITEALLADDRILQVDSFVFTPIRKGYVIQFTAHTTQGNIESEFTFEGGDGA